MKRPKSDYAIQTVTNALCLLDALRAEDELGVTELSRRLGLHKNNVFRLLATLEERGYVEQTPNGDRYRLSFSCLELGQAFVRSRDLLREAQPVLARLAHDLGETAHLGALRDYQVVHLAGERPDHLLHAGLRIGHRVLPHCSALGKVLLACAEDGVRQTYDREIVAGGALPAYTPATITDGVKLQEHLRSVASQGFAVDLEECEAGVCCAAAPVYDGTSRLVAALSVSGPAVRLGPEPLLRKIVPRVVAAAEELSARLGFPVAAGSPVT